VASTARLELLSRTEISLELTATRVVYIHMGCRSMWTSVMISEPFLIMSRRFRASEMSQLIEFGYNDVYTHYFHLSDKAVIVNHIMPPCK
jgi:hypothetical protein